MFNLCHWLKVSDEAKLRETVLLAKPYLAAVTLNGCDHAEVVRAKGDRWILPLDDGAFDNGVLLRALWEAGFTGPVGLQCYGIPGDARDHLARSIAAWRKLKDRLLLELKA